LWGMLASTRRSWFFSPGRLRQKRLLLAFASLSLCMAPTWIPPVCHDALLVPASGPPQMNLLHVSERGPGFRIPSSIEHVLYGGCFSREGEATTSWTESYGKCFKETFHITVPAFHDIVKYLTAINDGQSGRIISSSPRNPALRVRAEVKIAVAIYHYAHGGGLKGTAFSAGRSKPWVHHILRTVSASINLRMSPILLRKPTPQEQELITAEFARRHQVGNVGLAGDGTHVPYKPCNAWLEPDHLNYKGFR
jgi:hypothetical protein